MMDATHCNASKWKEVLWAKAFLVALAKSGNVAEGCRLAKIERSTAYRLRKEDPDFASEWERACENYADLLEKEADRRARKGYLRPVFYQGKSVGKVREYSDYLMGLLLKAAKPEKYRERKDITSDGESLGDVFAKIFGKDDSDASDVA